jgi:hypothetical protein
MMHSGEWEPAACSAGWAALSARVMAARAAARKKVEKQGLTSDAAPRILPA